jgi:hypothetical protein
MIIINPIINFILKLIKGEAWVRHIERMKLKNTDFTILRFYDFSLCRIFDFPKSSTFTKVVIVARNISCSRWSTVSCAVWTVRLSAEAICISTMALSTSMNWWALFHPTICSDLFGLLGGVPGCARAICELV